MNLNKGDVIIVNDRTFEVLRSTELVCTLKATKYPYSMGIITKVSGTNDNPVQARVISDTVENCFIANDTVNNNYVYSSGHARTIGCTNNTDSSTCSENSYSYSSITSNTCSDSSDSYSSYSN